MQEIICEVWDFYPGEDDNVLLPGCGTVVDTSVPVLKMETVYSHETLVSTYDYTWRRDWRKQHRQEINYTYELVRNRDLTTTTIWLNSAANTTKNYILFKNI
jgi:hypothetical protein